MDNINYENFKNICRMCMLNCGTYFNKDSVILDIFHKLTDIHFETNNELPQQICLKCFGFINEINTFSITCKQTHSSLMKCLNNYKNKRIKQEPEIIEETNEEIETKDEITIEELKIEFVKEEHHNDCETNDPLKEDVTDSTKNDLLTPISTPKYEDISSSKHPSFPKIMIGKKMKNPSFKCDQCEKSYTRSNDLVKHMRVHGGERRFTCEECEKSFKHSNALVRHKRVHSSKCPYKCNQCEKSFSQSGHLIKHKRVHSGERPYKCNQCEMSFTESGNLTRHKRVHSGERPYKCDQCNTSFKGSYHLLRHKRIHSGERPYKCNQCEKSYAQSNDLVRHKRSHSDK